MWAMFVLELRYIAPLERVQAALAEHMSWLDENFAAGLFLASGPKVPHDGAVILAAGEDRAKMEQIAESDPFSLAGVTEYTITEFLARKTAPGLEAYGEEGRG